jgi:hypothetical protein
VAPRAEIKKSTKHSQEILEDQERISHVRAGLKILPLPMNNLFLQLLRFIYEF